MINKKEPWGTATSSPPDREIRGTDAELAQCVAGAPGALVQFFPARASDLARAIGLDTEAPPSGVALPMDALVLADGRFAVNMVVFGSRPDRLTRFSRAIAMRVRIDDDPWFEGRATTIVVAIGQWLAGADLVPRGHPGDGRAEAQAYRLRPNERRPMRSRLVTGGHVPHPRIFQRSIRRIEVEAARALPFEVDGVGQGRVSRLVAEVRPEAYRLLV